MNLVPVAYKKLKEEQRLAREKSSEENKKMASNQNKDQIALYEKLLKAIWPYHDIEVENHRIRLYNYPEKLSIELFIDHDLWATFKIKLTYYYCSCDNTCAHEPNASVSLEVIQHKKRGNYDCYFRCHKDQLDNEDSFAVALDELIQSYKWRNLS